ncbi:MAG TPA: hypothetical protein VLC28_00525, partial [Flavitalea sp.]|nr:hypothetical protein [Flavitalea sp.]
AELKSFYINSTQHHEDMIEAYRNSNDPGRFDKILGELNALQNIYTSLQATPGSFALVKPKNYQRDIQQVSENAAAEYYELGMNLMQQEDRESAFDAYNAFKNSNRFVNGYRDADRLMRQSYERSVVNIIINPIEDNNVMFSRFDSWGNDFRYRPEEYQQALARDLSSRNGNDIPARFLTDREADRKRINPDYEISLNWRNLDGLRGYPNRYSRRVSKSIQVGSDTSGRPVYKNVYATLQITQNTFQVRGDLEYQVADVQHHSNLDYGTVSNEVQWDDRYATYSGDSRALSQEDWALVNNAHSGQSPSRGDIMNELMRKMYPELRRRIEGAIN